MKTFLKISIFSFLFSILIPFNFSLAASVTNFTYAPATTNILENAIGYVLGSIFPPLAVPNANDAYLTWDTTGYSSCVCHYVDHLGTSHDCTPSGSTVGSGVISAKILASYLTTHRIGNPITATLSCVPTPVCVAGNETFSKNGTWTAPAGIENCSVKFEVWGGGGGGEGGETSSGSYGVGCGGMGGQAGGYGVKTLPVGSVSAGYSFLVGLGVGGDAVDRGNCYGPCGSGTGSWIYTSDYSSIISANGGFSGNPSTNKSDFSGGLATSPSNGATGGTGTCGSGSGKDACSGIGGAGGSSSVGSGGAGSNNRCSGGSGGSGSAGGIASGGGGGAGGRSSLLSGNNGGSGGAGGPAYAKISWY